MADSARLLIDTLRFAPPDDARALATAWSAADAGAIVRLVEYEGVALWLHRRLKSLGVTLDGEPRVRLAAGARHATAHSLRTDAEATASLAILSAAGVPAVLLKGAAMRRIAARVRDADARASSDVDLIVPADLAQHAWDALVASGYSPPKTSGPADGHHLPALAGPIGIAVEIHTTTVAATPGAEAWRRASHDGDAVLAVSSDTELLWNAVAHAVVTAADAGRSGVRLRYWLDPAALLASSTTIDWDRIRARLLSSECAFPDLARVWLRTASDLAGVALPEDALGNERANRFDLERVLSWRLRVLARPDQKSRWVEKLLEEGARGEVSLPIEPPHRAASTPARLRHAVASRAARLWWVIHR